MPGSAHPTGRASAGLSMGRTANRPRVKIPFKTEKQKYQVFRDLVDEKVKAKCIHERPVIDDDSFVQRMLPS